MNGLLATNTLSTRPAAGTDAEGSAAAGAQGRAGGTLTPETTRKHIGLYAMATEGLRVPAATEIACLMPVRSKTALAIRIGRGFDVLRAFEHYGKDAVRCIDDARSLRILLGYLAGRFAGIEHDTLVRDGVSKLEVAEIRMGIRHRNGELRREWM